MSTTEEIDNTSDVSSNSSWTVLDEDSSYEYFRSRILKPTEVQELSRGDSQDCVVLEEDGAKSCEKIQEVQNTEVSEEPQQKLEEMNREGFLTLEEYVAERAIEHDYEYDEKTLMFDDMLKKNTKQDIKQRRKTKANTLSSLSIMGAILSVAGISLLCLLTPHTAISRNKLSENIKTNFTKVAENCCDQGKYEVYLDDSNEAMYLMDRYNIFQQCFNNINEDTATCQDKIYTTEESSKIKNNIYQPTTKENASNLKDDKLDENDANKVTNNYLSPTSYEQYYIKKAEEIKKDLKIINPMTYEEYLKTLEDSTPTKENKKGNTCLRIEENTKQNEAPNETKTNADSKKENLESNNKQKKNIKKDNNEVSTKKPMVNSKENTSSNKMVKEKQETKTKPKTPKAHVGEARKDEKKITKSKISPHLTKKETVGKTKKRMKLNYFSI